VTPIIDRFNFREPGRVLFELATNRPSFSIDEDVATLGERLSLPPFLEPQRPVFETQLRPIRPVELTTRV
jgi:glyoxalase family protein